MTASLQQREAQSAQETVRVLGPAWHAPISMLDLWKYRDLTRMMIGRDLVGKYKGSMLGLIWPVLNPVGHLLLYTFVFSIVLKVRFGHDGSTTNFAIYLMTGLTAWLAFAECLTRASTAILEVPNLVKRVVFPLEILPLVIVISSAFTASISFLVLALGATIYTGAIHSTLLFIPLILASQLLFTGGMCWLAASIGVFIQDLRHFMSLGLSVWMYGTPIVYPATAFPANLKFLGWVNPMAGIIGDYRRVIIEGLPPDWSIYAYYTLVGATLWVAGYYFFAKTKQSFADVM
jgi:lipopolysaccharide transport system permease protein